MWVGFDSFGGSFHPEFSDGAVMEGELSIQDGCATVGIFPKDCAMSLTFQDFKEQHSV